MARFFEEIFFFLKIHLANSRFVLKRVRDVVGGGAGAAACRAR